MGSMGTNEMCVIYSVTYVLDLNDKEKCLCMHCCRDVVYVHRQFSLTSQQPTVFTHHCIVSADATFKHVQNTQARLSLVGI